jgi:hypothetical protein
MSPASTLRATRASEITGSRRVQLTFPVVAANRIWFTVILLCGMSLWINPASNTSWLESFQSVVLWPPKMYHCLRLVIAVGFPTR